MSKFSHLHVHTQFSLLDGAASIKSLYEKAVKNEMPALAITDHGNMFGAFDFVAQAQKINGKAGKEVIKPIVGCEFYLVEDRHKKAFTKDDKDKRYHQLFLAKNAEGYKNLVKLCSLGYIEGMYSKYPRIDKELVLKYHKDLIATTCCIGASVPQAILKKDEATARKEFEWWLDVFGEDYYVEIQRHGMKEQDLINETLLKFAKEYNVKVIATNDSHYTDQEDSNAHDILLCINTGEKQSTPAIRDFSDESLSSKNTRFAFFNDQFYFKTGEEMSHLFKDVPESIDNTNEIVSKVEMLKLEKDILLPNFTVPLEFSSQDEYLEHMTWTGARDRYREITPEIEERLNFELFTIRTMGFAGYFLIVADFIRAGRDMGVFVGPGRGSAAGSAVAYCIGITNIDPIAYKLLFERFLNPDRKSMPDIDTDFDDEGRDKVIDYVVKKYGQNQVAQIVTYGTMAAKSSIKDVARVLDLGIPEANALTKMIPANPKTSLKLLFDFKIEVTGKKDSLKDILDLQPEEIENVENLRKQYKSNSNEGKVLKEATKLEGSVRQTGIHAAGIIIAPKDLTEILPICTSKDSPFYITQYEGNIIENAGVIKMDFLGLKNLTIIKNCLAVIKENLGIVIDIDTIPLDDEATFKIYQKGETNGTFQFESPGMQKHLKELKPDKFEDLIAMNALYRPGPIEYIPKFIARKHGKEAITYDIEDMKEYLEETNGITVYQEQVMLLSQKLANFTKGDADTLRKAMGKKQKDILDKMKGKFLDGCKENGHNLKVSEKVWTDWEAFAQYAFNKSHSTCYAFVAFQTAYLKANYPAEYMASLLTNNKDTSDKVTFYMQECQRMGLSVLGPDVNESTWNFTVNKKGQIRFGLAAIKGVGESAAEAIIAERKENGNYTDIFDFSIRTNFRIVTKRVLEALACAGGFDGFGLNRANYFHLQTDGNKTLIENLILYSAKMKLQKESAQQSLFSIGGNQDMVAPNITECEEWQLFEKLTKEKECIGIFLSGHPLDQFKVEMTKLCNTTMNDIPNLKASDRMLIIGGIVVSSMIRTSKNMKQFCLFEVQDYDGLYRFIIGGEEFLKYGHLAQVGEFILLKGRVTPYYNTDKTDFKISSLAMLADAREKHFKNVCLKIDLAQIDKNLILELKELCFLHEGKSNLEIKVMDKENRLELDFYSKKFKVDISNEFVDSLRQLIGEESLNFKIEL